MARAVKGRSGGSPATLLLLSPVIWGTTFPAAKVAIRHLDVLPMTAWSRTLGLVALLVAVVIARAGRRLCDRRLVGPGCALGALITVAYVSQTFGLRSTTATNAGFITGLYVVFVPLLGALTHRGSVTAASWRAAALAASGLGLLTLRDLSVHIGDALVLVSAIAFAVHFLALQRWAPRHDPLALCVAQMAPAAALSVMLAAPQGVELDGARRAWTVLMVTGVLGSGVAYLLQVVAQQELSAARAAVVLAGESVVAALTSAVWLGERLDPRQWLGAGLMLAAIVLSELEASRRPPPAVVTTPATDRR